MRVTTLFNKLLNLQGLRVTGVRFEQDQVIVSIQPWCRLMTCPECGHRKKGRKSTALRRWRHLAVWGREVLLEGPVRRMTCPRCVAVVTETVPWARPGSVFTAAFEDVVAHLAQRLDKTSVAALCGISWVTVGAIAGRVVAERLDPERLKNLRRIAVDEISFRKRHRYLTVVTDHDTRRVIWVGEGKTSEVLKSFFRTIGADACQRITIVTMDMSAPYEKAVREDLPNAHIAFDHFHIARLANEALNEVRRELVRAAKDQSPAAAHEIKNTMWALLWRLPNLPDHHLTKIGQLRPTQPLGRAYLLKETLLEILHASMRTPADALRAWLGWASRSRLRPFVRLAATLRARLAGVLAIFQQRLSNGLAEGMNNKIRLLSHRAYGFHSAAPLIATIYLCCAGIRLPQPQLP